MPTYEYRCYDCAHLWDEQRPSDARHAQALCPKCRGRGRLAFTATPALAWYPDSTRPPYKK